MSHFFPWACSLPGAQKAKSGPPPFSTRAENRLKPHRKSIRFQNQRGQLCPPHPCRSPGGASQPSPPSSACPCHQTPGSLGLRLQQGQRDKVREGVRAAVAQAVRDASLLSISPVWGCRNGSPARKGHGSDGGQFSVPISVPYLQDLFPECVCPHSEHLHILSSTK